MLENTLICMLLGYRYDNEIINYFNEPYKKAILNLYKDGYPVKDKYMRLKDEYKSRYSPLNSEKIEFFSSYQESKANSSLDITTVKISLFLHLFNPLKIQSF